MTKARQIITEGGFKVVIAESMDGKQVRVEVRRPGEYEIASWCDAWVDKTRAARQGGASNPVVM